MRTYPEIWNEVVKAVEKSDHKLIMALADELALIDSPEARAASERTKGIAYGLTVSLSEAVEHFHRAHSIYEELGDRLHSAQTLSDIGTAYLNMSAYGEALEYLTRGMEGFEDLEVVSSMSGAYANIGNVYQATGYYVEAMEHFQRSLALSEEHNNLSHIAYATTGIGLLHLHLGSHEEALEHFQRSVVMHQTLGNRKNEADVYGSMGAAYGGMNRFAEANEFSQRAVNILEEIGNHRSAALFLSNMISCSVQQGEFEHASALLEQHESMFQVATPEVRASCLSYKSKILIHHNDLEGARARLLESLQVAVESGIRLYEAEIHKDLRDLAQRRGEFADYIHHNTEYQRIQEEVNGKATAQKVAVMSAERTMAKERTERSREQAILYGALPKEIADRMIRGEEVSDHIDAASVVFVDIVGLTTLSSTLTSQQVTTLLDTVFALCDEACARNDVMKVKTIGDSYMCFSHDAHAA